MATVYDSVQQPPPEKRNADFFERSVECKIKAERRFFFFFSNPPADAEKSSLTKLRRVCGQIYQPVSSEESRQQ